MKKIGIAIVVLLGLLGAYKLAYPTVTWNQKMTVVLDVNGETVSGSSVTQVSYSRQPHFLPDMAVVASSAKGEAVDVKLPNGRHLFALLTSTSSQEYIEYIAPMLRSKSKLANVSDTSNSKYAISDLHRTYTIPTENYPTLVTFRDINNPTTVALVDPNNMSAEFGSGISLRAITLKITDEPITDGEIAKSLGWWKNHRDARGRILSIRYRDNNPRGYNTLSPMDFWTLDRVVK